MILKVKWSGTEYLVDISDLVDTNTVIDIKNKVYEKTEVQPDRQKILNLKQKNGKVAADTTTISQLNVKDGMKLMMMGSREETIVSANTKPDDLPEVIDDLEFTEEEVEAQHDPVYLKKVERRIDEYELKFINPPREGRKLLVLDIDYTLFDHRSVAEQAGELMRPYLHEFLEAAYDDYDIIIWSATSLKWIEEKMRVLGVTDNPNYKITAHVDDSAMISVHTGKGVVEVKPLPVLWAKLSQYDATNTIMFDDIRRNFIMNPQSGLRIHSFRNAHQNRSSDRELLKLSKYLKLIARLPDFLKLNHRHWEDYVRRHK